MTMVYLRNTWGARDPHPMTGGNVPHECFIHHSENEDAHGVVSLASQKRAVKAIQDFHMDGRGWSDIAYHYIVFQDFRGDGGRVFQGRDYHYVPAAQLNHNTNTLAICIYGDGRRDDMRPHTRYLIERLLKRFPNVSRVGGHRDVVSTECPGDKFYGSIPRIAKAAGIHLYGH